MLPPSHIQDIIKCLEKLGTVKALSEIIFYFEVADSLRQFME